MTHRKPETAAAYGPDGRKKPAPKRKPKPVRLDISDISWVKSGRTRTRVLKSITIYRHYTPWDLGEINGIHSKQASKYLRDFLERGIVECANPKKIRGRLYHITRKGENIQRNL